MTREIISFDVECQNSNWWNLAASLNIFSTLASGEDSGFGNASCVLNLSERAFICVCTRSQFWSFDAAWIIPAIYSIFFGYSGFEMINAL